MVEISTSLLSVEKEKIIKTIYNLETAKTDYFHIDVMDGEFVENDTTEKMLEYCDYLSNITNIPLDVHLMVSDVRKYIDLFLPYNPNIITIHYEAFSDKDELINALDYIKSNNCKAGISIKPNTSVELVYPYLKDIDLVLVMSVEPGMGGQKFIPSSKDKIDKLKEYKINNSLDYVISVDGGINSETIKLVGNSDMVVSGNFITSGDMEKNIELLKDYSVE